METNKSSSKTLQLVMCALCAAIMAVCAQVTIPLPMMPITLQTFGVALCAAVCGAFTGTVSTAVYVLIGALGVPVYSGMKGGFSVLFGVTGGFLFGFIVMAFLCGIAAGKMWQRILLSLAGLAVCYACGAVQYALVTGTDLITSVTLVVLPFAVKDILSVAAAQYVAIPIRRAVASMTRE